MRPERLSRGLRGRPRIHISPAAPSRRLPSGSGGPNALLRDDHANAKLPVRRRREVPPNRRLECHRALSAVDWTARRLAASLRRRLGPLRHTPATPSSPHDAAARFRRARLGATAAPWPPRSAAALEHRAGADTPCTLNPAIPLAHRSGARQPRWRSPRGAASPSASRTDRARAPPDSRGHAPPSNHTFRDRRAQRWRPSRRRAGAAAAAVAPRTAAGPLLRHAMPP